MNPLRLPGVPTPVPPLATSHISPGRISNREFFLALGKSLLALALSAIILVAGYLVFFPGLAGKSEVAGNNAAGPRLIRGDDLQVRLGTGKATDDGAMLLTGMHKAEDERAILTRRTSFAASDYSFIEYTLRGRNPKEAVYLLWRTAENPEKVSNVPLPWRGNDTGMAFLGLLPEWSGQITEIGLDIYGDLRGQPLAISNLTLLPRARTALLQTIWFEWTAFRGWTQKSANFLRGSPEHGVLAPTLAMAVWSGLALFILAGISRRFRRSHDVVAYASAVLIPWIVLDLLWQADLSRQLDETRYLFAGKTQHEKHLADLDPELYEYAEYLKNEVLPEPGPRIFLLHDSDQMTYTRLKAQFYLLPHNIFNYDRFPRKKATRAGDYILVLGSVNGLEFSPAASTLAWRDKSLPVTLVDSRPDGNLYKVTKRGKKRVTPAP